MELTFIFLRNILGYVLLMGILITIHEFGHFITAKKLGIKILTFSIGFGKPIWSRISKEGIKYQIGMIPLGGYVSMLGEGGEAVSKDEIKRTFRAQSLGRRALVVGAGPAFNIFLGFILYWGLFIYGMPDLKAEIAQPTQGSYLEAAGLQKGDLITSVGGKTIPSFTSARITFIDKLLDDGKTVIGIERAGKHLELPLDIGRPFQLGAKTNIEGILGLMPNIYTPKILAVIGDLTDDSAAKAAGLKANDKILSIAGMPVKEWTDISLALNKTKDDKPLDIVVERENKSLTFAVTPKFNANEKRYLLGIRNGINELSAADEEKIRNDLGRLKITVQYGIFSSLKNAFFHTVDDSTLIFKIIKRMLTGDVKITAMSGPIAIADITGQMLSAGIGAFVILLAGVSINIGIMNLLPVPVLDGGHLFSYAIKAIIGKDRIPPVWGEWALRVGAAMLMLFMATVVFNDVDKYLGISDLFFRFF